MLKALHRRRVTKALHALVEQIEALTGKTAGQMSIFPGPLGGTERIEIAWEHADAVAQLARATGMTCTMLGRRRLVVGDLDQCVRITVQMPLRVIAELLADVLTGLDAEPGTGTLTAQNLHNALTTVDPASAADYQASGVTVSVRGGPLWAALDELPFGAGPVATPLTDMLATLLLDAAGLDGHEQVGDLRLAPSLERLLDGHLERPWLIATARALTAADDTAAARVVTVTRTSSEPPGRSA